MKLREIYHNVDAVAPFSLSDEYCAKYGAYDNSGIIIDCGEEILRVLFSLDCSPSAVAQAKKIGANLIVSHHPAIYEPLKRLEADSAVLQAAKAGISVLSAHLNLDVAEGGVDDSLVQALGGNVEEVMHPLSCGGYGKAVSVQTTVQKLKERVQKTLSTQRVLVYGEDRPIKKIASFCGAGMDGDAIAFAMRVGAEAIVTSDGKHHHVAQALDSGLNVVLLTHYASENYGFFRFYQKIKEKLTVPCEYFTDGRLL